MNRTAGLLLLFLGVLVSSAAAGPPAIGPVAQTLPRTAVVSVASNPTPPVSSFQAGRRTFRPTGTSVQHFSTWVPLALCQVPPFQRVIPRPRGAHLVQGQSVIVLPGGQRALLTYDLTYEKLVPLSLWPEQVDTLFTQGELSNSSQGTGAYLSCAWTVGYGVGVEAEGYGFGMQVKQGIEATAEAATGARRTVVTEVKGGYSANNWLCSEEAVVFATQTLYDCYEYAAQGAPNLTVWINVPTNVTSRVFSLTDWNNYAAEKNDDGEPLRNLPVFTPALNLSGEVPAYPQKESNYVISATGRFCSQANNLWIGGSLYIDRNGGSLGAKQTISEDQWYSASRRVGATTEFEAEGRVPGAQIAGSSSLAIGQTFATELASGHSIAGEWHTSSVYSRLDGGEGSFFDYHFRLKPRLAALTYFPGASFGTLAKLTAHLNATLAVSPVGVTVVEQADGLYVTGLNKPLALLADSDQAAPYCGRVLLLDYLVWDLGKSYTKGPEETYRLAQALIANKVVVPIAQPPTQPPQSNFYVQIPWAGLQLATPISAKPGFYLANPLLYDPRQLTVNPQHGSVWADDIPWAKATR